LHHNKCQLTDFRPFYETMKIICALRIFPLSLLLVGSVHLATSTSSSPQEEKCLEKLDEEKETDVYKQHQGRCECVPLNPFNNELDIWKLRCNYDCEFCFEDECVIFSTESFFSPLAGTTSQSCMQDRNENKFCMKLIAGLGNVLVKASINGQECTSAGFCPDDGGSTGLFRYDCSNIGQAGDACTAQGIADLQGGPLYFPARLFIDGSDEEPTVGKCHTRVDDSRKRKIIQRTSIGFQMVDWMRS